jgi:hypothetical protein
VAIWKSIVANSYSYQPRNKHLDDKFLVIIPVPTTEEDRKELEQFLSDNLDTVLCRDFEKPSNYWFNDDVITSHTVYFDHKEDATTFYLRWDGYGTKLG